MELARTGELVGNKVGRLVLVRKAHARAYIEQGAAQVEAACDGGGGQVEAGQAELLADWGLVGRGYK